MSDASARANILIVDDKLENMVALEAILSGLDQNIKRANSGREALRFLLAEEFAVILMDVNMPDLDGLEAAALIRQRPRTQHVPIIFITASADEMHMARSYSLGAVDYIQTPVVADVLRSKVSVFIELHQKTEQVRRQTELERRRATQLQKLSVASMAINSAAAIDDMLRTIAQAARDLLECHQCVTLFLADPAAAGSRTRIQSAVSFSDKYTKWRDRRLKLEPLVATIIAQKPCVTRLAEAELRDDSDMDLLLLRRAELPPLHGGLLAAPLRHLDGKNLGMILLVEHIGGPFTREDESLLMQLAQIASIAIQNAVFAQEREANRLKDEFLATLSHELRTPLNAIVGWTQLLRMQKLPAEAQHGLEVIDRNVKAQTKLIEDLLDVSRINAGKMRLSFRNVAMHGIVQVAIDAIRPVAETKGVQLAVELQAEPQVYGDPDRLQQVAWNLLSNAVKFTPAGGRVHVVMQQNAGDLQIRVSDSGVGIDPDFLRFVFDRFRQADSTTTRSHGGLGIGLTIVRHIVEMHGGTVAAHSAGLGHGAAFTVTLPVAPPRAPAFDPQRDGEPLASSPEISVVLTGKRILVVDDEADAREMLAEMLRRAHADVVVASSVPQALESIAARAPHVLVSDIGMPGEDGFSLIRALRQVPADRGGSTPAIALTAYAREEDRLRALRAGFNLHLTKPVDPAEFISAVARLSSPDYRSAADAPADPLSQTQGSARPA
jgi:signal transduction histidine kinase